MVPHHSGSGGRLRRSIAIAVLAVAVAAGVAPGVVQGSVPVLLSDPLPACERGDDPAPKQEYGQWRSTLLDTTYRLPRRYVPPHLVSTAKAGLNSGSFVRRLVIDDLDALRRAARRAGVTIRVNSGYRSYSQQAALYRAEVERLGAAEAALVVARPGHSEHQLGTALDIANMTGSYTWLAQRGWRFGFVVSYPRSARSVSCYRYEPWHLRYYGRTRAAAIHESGLVPREWLWINAVAGAR